MHAKLDVYLKMESNYEECVRALRNKALEFGSTIEHVKKLNEDVVTKAQLALEGIVKLVGYARPVSEIQRKCTVCVTREIVAAVSPCGHTFCSSCAQRAARARCHTCRSNVDGVLRIYIN